MVAYVRRKAPPTAGLALGRAVALAGRFICGDRFFLTRFAIVVTPLEKLSSEVGLPSYLPAILPGDGHHAGSRRQIAPVVGPPTPRLLVRHLVHQARMLDGDEEGPV